MSVLVDIFFQGIFYFKVVEEVVINYVDCLKCICVDLMCCCVSFVVGVKYQYQGKLFDVYVYVFILYQMYVLSNMFNEDFYVVFCEVFMYVECMFVEVNGK